MRRRSRYTGPTTIGASNHSASNCLGRTGKRPTLGRDIGAGDRDELFGGADPDIGRRNVAEKRDENLVVVRDRGEIGGVGRFDPAAKFAPKIQFPGRLDGKRISPETVGAGFGGASGVAALVRL
jgi:hypothetical protein